MTNTEKNELYLAIESLYDDDNYTDAILLYENADESLKTDDVQSYIAVGYNNDGQYTKAVEILLPLENKTSNELQRLYRLAYAYYQLDYDQKNIETCKKAFELAKINPELDTNSYMEGLKEFYEYAMETEEPQIIEKHDDVSDIIVTGEDFEEQYNFLWDFLVPSNGKANSAQGECIRLAGKLSYEIFNNGGINWCSDFKHMAHTLYEYLKTGKALDNDKLLVAEKITKTINRNVDEESITTLSRFTVEWISKNPKPMPLIEGKYKR